MTKHDFTTENHFKNIKPFESKLWSSNIDAFVEVEILSVNSLEGLKGCNED